MTFFPDLSEYEYYDQHSALNVGWLEMGREFTKGYVSPEHIKTLENFVLYPVKNARGWLPCPFCPDDISNPYTIEGAKYFLGAAEIRIFSADLKKVYACPNLIIHYITEHNYRPPDEFLDALSTGPLPPSKKYTDALTNIGLQTGQLSVYSKPFRLFSEK